MSRLVFGRTGAEIERLIAAGVASIGIGGAVVAASRARRSEADADETAHDASDQPTLDGPDG